ncbi:hypothetical protein PAMP_003210 [Pampus punctatissimus]
MDDTKRKQKSANPSPAQREPSSCTSMADQKDNIDDFKVQTAKHPNIGSASLRPHSEHSKDRASKRLSSDSNGTSEGGMGSSTPVELTALEESFRRFAIHGDTRATGKDLHGKNWSKLCKDCGVIDGKNITLTDVDIVFSKVNDLCGDLRRTQSHLPWTKMAAGSPVSPLTIDSMEQAQEEWSAQMFN